MTPLAPASASRVATAPAVAAADDLVRVGHRHERQAGSGGADPARGASIERSRVAPGGERRARGALERRAVGEWIGVRQADLEQVGPAVGRGEGDREARLGVRIAGHDVRDERRPAVGPGRREGRRDPPRAGGVVRARGRGVRGSAPASAVIRAPPRPARGGRGPCRPGR